MSDGIIRGLLREQNLTVAVAVATDAARTARTQHQLGQAAASLLGQALTAGALLAALQKGESHINLQLECDGALRGLFVDASAGGDVRGYVKNPHVEVELAEGQFRWRGALGNSGFLSVLRHVGEGEYYRSSVELVELSLVGDLNRYFALSDQVATRLDLEVRREEGEPLGVVAGVLLQALPDGDVAALEALGATLHSRLVGVVAAGARTPAEVLQGLGLEKYDVMQESALRWACTCSKARALTTIEGLGLAEVQALLAERGSTAVTCQFCGTRHAVSGEELGEIISRLTIGPKS